MRVQPLAVGKVDDGRVKDHVLAADGDPILGGACRSCPPDSRTHARYCRMIRVGLGERLAFDHAAYPVDIDDRSHTGRGDKDAAIGFVPEQAFLLQGTIEQVLERAEQMKREAA